MINALKFFGAAALSAALVYALNTSFAVGGQPLPAFGKLLNPFTGVWQNTPAPVAKPFLPVTSDKLKGRVSVSYDERLVPHIFADSTIDAFFVQGYIHAQNRLFQMDFSTRATAGRLSEVLGSRTLDFDKEQRRIGMVWAAQNTVQLWEKDPATKLVLDAYVNGVNAYIVSLTPKDYPIEYKLMGFSPEPWSMLKCALFYKGMAKSLNFSDNDLEMTKLREVFGAAAVAQLFPDYFPEQRPIIPAGTKFDFKAPELKGTAPNLEAPKLSLHGQPVDKGIEGLGSNNWAVSGSKTLNKAPLLCGDPHLGRTLPAIWYEQQMSTSLFNCYGVTFPGLPGIVIGFNSKIAWTVTNMEHDVKDWYTIAWTDSTKTAYSLDGDSKKADLVVEKIKVLGVLEPVLDTVRYTVWGPVVYENDSSAYKNMALRWISHDKGTGKELFSFLKMMQAENYTDFKSALGNYHSPGQNFCFASVSGDIAMHVNGAIPIRAKDQGRYIQDGSKSSNGWSGMVPREHLPFVANPSSGFVFSANQHSTAPGYPYPYIGNGFDETRARYLHKRLSEMDSISVDDMKALQNDPTSIRATELLPVLLKLIDTAAITDPTSAKAIADLKDWDYKFTADAMAPLLYFTWFNNIEESTWDEMLTHPDANIMKLASKGRLATLLAQEPNSLWFDLVGSQPKETAKEIVTTAFQKTMKDIAAQLVLDPKLSWGSFNNIGARHIARLDGFSRLNIKSNGTKEALNANSSTWGPSWRMIVELTQPIKAWVVYPGGQSGDPASANYDSFIDTWAKGEYFEALFFEKRPEKNPKIKFEQVFSPLPKK